MPPISPPPPMGTSTVSKSGRSDRSSVAMVPWPATTSGSSYACTKVAPLSFCAASAPNRTCSEPWARFDLERFCRLRDVHRRGGVEGRGGVRDAHAMVAGRSGDNPRGTLVLGHADQLRQRPADFESANRLDRLDFEVHVAARLLRERVRILQRRGGEVHPQVAGGPVDVGGYHQAMSDELDRISPRESARVKARDKKVRGPKVISVNPGLRKLAQHLADKSRKTKETN